MKSPKIDVRIPYEPDGKLGWDYNRVMTETPHEWVLFIDHDVILSTNPHWYHICQETIKNHNPALATCYTNAHHKTGQQYTPILRAKETTSFQYHRAVAKEVWERYRYGIKSIPKVSGFFMLISKTWWKSVQGFPAKGMFREDWTFSSNIHRNKGKMVIMQGLYVYHAKERTDKWIEGENVTLDYLEAKRTKKKK